MFLICFLFTKLSIYFSKYFQIKLSLRQTETNIRLNDINKTPFTLTWCWCWMWLEGGEGGEGGGREEEGGGEV